MTALVAPSQATSASAVQAGASPSQAAPLPSAPCLSLSSEEQTFLLAHRLDMAIRGSDSDALATMLVGAQVPRNQGQGDVRLTDARAAKDWLEKGPGLESRGVDSCQQDCCVFEDHDGNGWGDIPSHPIKACFVSERVSRLTLERGAP
ncbi:MAG: hypothetical protein U0271_05815 [Polyangiaceae bacterium]